MANPRVLVLGGLGFIGKHLVKYLVENGLTSKIRVVDKIMLAMGRLDKNYTDIFSKVEVLQANLSNQDAVNKSFIDPEGDYNIVINLAGETKLSQEDKVYQEGTTKLSILVAQAALNHHVQKFIEVSAAELYEPSHKPANEQHALKPWTGIGKAKLKAEEQLKAMKELPLIIVRPAIVYGPFDIRGLAPRLCIAAIYKKNNEVLEFPNWFEEDKINTVHVSDVAKAIWHVAVNGTPGSIYNLADKSDLNQKKLNLFLEKLFGMKTGQLGLIKSEAIKLLPNTTLLDEINSDTVPDWTRMIVEAKLDFSPLSPYLDAEAVANKSLCVDGSAIEQTGFNYDHPEVTADLLKAQIDRAVADGWFPPNLTV